MLSTLITASIIFSSLLGAAGRIYFEETFDDGGESFRTNWHKSQTFASDEKHRIGEWEISASSAPYSFEVEAGSPSLYMFPGEEVPKDHLDHGLKTVKDHSFYAVSAPLNRPFFSVNRTLFVQFSVRFEQSDGLDCGGAYIKLFPTGIDPHRLDGTTPYALMFGPDICGTGTQRTQFVLGYDATHGSGVHVIRRTHSVQKRLHCETDKGTHLYTLVVTPQNTYEFRIDGFRVDGGYLSEDFDVLPSQTIIDHSAIKPDDWVDDQFLPDPNHPPPHQEYSNEPKYIPDPQKRKPAFWNEDEDGEWEPPLIANPRWREIWEPQMIANPDYKGIWSPPLILNPDYDPHAANTIYQQCNPCGHVGFELWQVDAGTVFDDILISDAEEEIEQNTKRVLEKMAWERASLTLKTAKPAV